MIVAHGKQNTSNNLMVYTKFQNTVNINNILSCLFKLQLMAIKTTKCHNTITLNYVASLYHKHAQLLELQSASH